MTYILSLQIRVEQHKERDTWVVSSDDTPYGYIYGTGGTLEEAIQNFDFHYVVEKDRKEHEE